MKINFDPHRFYFTLPLDNVSKVSYIKCVPGQSAIILMRYGSRARKGSTMSNNLTEAYSQWSSRPADQRFSSLEDLHEATTRHRSQARTASVATQDLRVEPVDGAVQLVGRTGNPAKLTHWSFGQLSSMAGAPASYLRSLPATLAVQNINHGIKNVSQREDNKLLLRENGGFHVRAFTSDRYSRIWNCDITRRLLDLPSYWVVPPARPSFEGQEGTRPATQQDVIAAGGFGLSIRVGDDIAPSGLYCSDEDMFCFMVDESHRLQDGGVARGFFVSNSEVGKMSFKIKLFYYVTVCGNHIVWGAQDVKEIKLRHVGAVNKKAFSELEATLIHYSNLSPAGEDARIETTKRHRLGNDKDAVLDFIFQGGFMSRRQAEEAYELAESNPVDGDPKTAWGMAMGTTRLSQAQSTAAARTQLDTAAGNILEVAF